VMTSHGPSARPADSSSIGTGMSSSLNSSAGGVFSGGLDAYKTVTEEDYRSLLSSGLIVLDANTLLSLYRYQSDTRRVLISIIARLKGQIWVPHQAMLEFFENRLSVIASRSEEAGQAINDLRRKSLELETVVRQWANRIGFDKGSTGKLIDSIQATVDNIAEKMGKQGSDDSLEQAEDTAKDPVIASLSPILDGCVGDPLSDDELVAANKEAKQRINDKRPPGWRDANKRENPGGDYLIWYETLREARRRGVDVLFVTGDVKDDWWWRDRGEAKGPLPELVYEMRETAGVRLFMLRPESLLVHAGNILGIRISDNTLQDAKRVTDEPMHTYSNVEEDTGRLYRRSDLTGAGSRSTLSYEWHGARPPQGRHWVYAREKMDQMYAEGRIEFTKSGRPVRKRYLDEQSNPAPETLNR
jgi:PIN like domain